jgi:hypothetical protein
MVNRAMKGINMNKEIIIKYLKDELEKLREVSIEHICHDCGKTTPESEEHGYLLDFLECKIKELK